MNVYPWVICCCLLLCIVTTQATSQHNEHPSQDHGQKLNSEGSPSSTPDLSNSNQDVSPQAPRSVRSSPGLSLETLHRNDDPLWAMRGTRSDVRSGQEDSYLTLGFPDERQINDDSEDEIYTNEEDINHDLTEESKISGNEDTEADLFLDHGKDENDTDGKSTDSYDDTSAQKRNQPFWVARGKKGISDYIPFYWGSNQNVWGKMPLRSAPLQTAISQSSGSLKLSQSPAVSGWESNQSLWGKRGETDPFWMARGRRDDNNGPFWISRGKKDAEIGHYWVTRGKRPSYMGRYWGSNPFELGKRSSEENDDDLTDVIDGEKSQKRTENYPLGGNHGSKSLLQESEENSPFWITRGRRSENATFWVTRGKKDGEGNPFWAARGKKEPEDKNPFWIARGKKEDDKNPFWVARGKKENEDPTNFWVARGKKESNLSPFWIARGKKERETPSPFWVARGKKEETNPFWVARGKKDDQNPFWVARGKKEDGTPFWVARGKKDNPSPFWVARGKKEDTNPFWVARGKKDSNPFWVARGKKENANPFWVARGKKENSNPFWVARGKKDSNNPFWVARGKKDSSNPFWVARGKKEGGVTYWIARGRKDDPTQYWMDNDKTSSSNPFWVARGKKDDTKNPFWVSRGKKDEETNSFWVARGKRAGNDNPFWVSRGKKEDGEENDESFWYSRGRRAPWTGRGKYTNHPSLLGNDRNLWMAYVMEALLGEQEGTPGLRGKKGSSSPSSIQQMAPSDNDDPLMKGFIALRG